MTTGTTKPFLALPEDINTPQPGYFHDVFHLVHAYLELIKNVSEFAVPSAGMTTLYGYRTGTLSFDNDLLIETYIQSIRGSNSQQKILGQFGQGMICYNLITLYRLLSNTLTQDLLRGFGDDNCLSSETIHGLNQFAKAQALQFQPNARLELHDNMGSVVETCSYNAFFPRGGVSSSQAIIRTIDVLDQLVASPGVVRDTSRRARLTNAVKMLFYIGASYYHLNLLRFSDEIIGRSYDHVLNINDFTLASVPFDPTLVYSCADGPGSISRWGIEYLQSLNAVLLYGGGIRYSAVLAVEANGNKGVSNV